MICPKCSTEMRQTYEPYEERCPQCGYWFDTWIGKEVVIDFDKIRVDEDEEDEYGE